jgi:hypothetical protein
MILANVIIIIYVVLIMLLLLIVLLNYNLIIINSNDSAIDAYSAINTYRDRKVNYE